MTRPVTFPLASPGLLASLREGDKGKSRSSSKVANSVFMKLQKSSEKLGVILISGLEMLIVSRNCDESSRLMDNGKS